MRTRVHGQCAMALHPLTAVLVHEASRLPRLPQPLPATRTLPSRRYGPLNVSAARRPRKTPFSISLLVASHRWQAGGAGSKTERGGGGGSGLQRQHDVALPAGSDDACPARRWKRFEGAWKQGAGPWRSAGARALALYGAEAGGVLPTRQCPPSAFL